MNAIRRRKVQLLPGHDAESVIPPIKVAHTVGAIFFWSMPVRGDPSTEFGFTVFASPALAIADEEPLIAGETIGCAIRLSLQRQVIGIVSAHQAGDVGDIFAQGLMAVHSEVGKR